MSKAGIIVTMGLVAVAGFVGFAIYSAVQEGAREEEAMRRSDHSYAVAMASADAFLKKTRPFIQIAPYDLKIGAEEAKAGVMAKLRDSESARWGEIWTVDGWHYCGTVNAKNAFGAYPGFQRFVAVSTDADLDVTDADWKAACSGGDIKLAQAAEPAPKAP